MCLLPLTRECLVNHRHVLQCKVYYIIIVMKELEVSLHKMRERRHVSKKTCITLSYKLMCLFYSYSNILEEDILLNPAISNPITIRLNST